MHLKKMESLSATEQSPTSTSSHGSAPEAYVDPPFDLRAHHLPRGHCGTCLPSSILKSFFLSLPGVSFFHQPYLYLTKIPHYPYSCHPSLVAVYSLAIHAFISFPQTSH